MVGNKKKEGEIMAFKVGGEYKESRDTVLWLEQDGDGVNLYAKLEGEFDDKADMILVITSDGMIIRRFYVDKRLGFQLNASGQVKDVGVDGCEDDEDGC